LQKDQIGIAFCMMNDETSEDLFNKPHGIVIAKYRAMKTAFGIASIVGGVALIGYGIEASNSLSSNVSRTFTGSPTDKTIWLLLGGVAAGILGLILVLPGFKKTSRK
jgi:hypothetical protein